MIDDNLSFMLMAIPSGKALKREFKDGADTKEIEKKHIVEVFYKFHFIREIKTDEGIDIEIQHERAEKPYDITYKDSVYGIPTNISEAINWVDEQEEHCVYYKDFAIRRYICGSNNRISWYVYENRLKDNEVGSKPRRVDFIFKHIQTAIMCIDCFGDEEGSLWGEKFKLFASRSRDLNGAWD